MEPPRTIRGYDTIIFLTDEGQKVYGRICRECGALVLTPDKHRNWHKKANEKRGG